MERQAVGLRYKPALMLISHPSALKLHRLPNLGMRTEYHHNIARH